MDDDFDSGNFYDEKNNILLLTDKDKAEFWERFTKGLSRELDFHKNKSKEKTVKIKELEAQLEKAEGVIRFYADKENWNERKLSPGYSYSPQYMSIGINDDAYLFEKTKNGQGYSGEWHEGACYVGGKKAREYFESKKKP